MNKILLGLMLLLVGACSPKISRLSSHAPVIRVKYHEKIINVNLDKYVAAVLAGEVHESWPMEALKAQAVAARTFALLRMRERRDRDFHTESSVMDQVFKTHASKKLADAARETAGLVLSYQNNLAEASFHSTCGGHTTDAKSVWGRGYAYLKGVPCTFCSSSPSYRWQQSIALSEVENKLKRPIKKISIKSKSADGRAEKISISPGGDISAQSLRMSIGPMRIKSTMMSELRISENKLIIAGSGFGHGVGMCQYGALGVAKQGKNFRDILGYYYPGTEITKIY